MKKVIKVISGVMLLALISASLSLIDKAEVMANGVAFVLNSSGDHTVTVLADGNGRARAEHGTGSSDAIICLIAEADSGNEFVEWTKRDTDDIQIINSTSATDAHFQMIDADVVVTAHFRATSPQPPSSPSDPPSTPPSDPPTPEEPPYEDTQAYFLDTVCNAVDDALGKLSDINITPQEIQDLKANGITIDAGVWESFDSTTCIKIDELLTKGVPVTIKYRHEGKNKEVTIPVDFGQKYKIFDMCDYDPNAGEGSAGYVGFEYIFASVVAGKPIDKNPPKTNRGEQTHNTVMGAEVGMAALSAGNDFIGAATEGLSLATNIGADGVSSFASMGGGSIRQETG